MEHQNVVIIDGSVLRKGVCVSQNVDLISFGIQMGATLDDLLQSQYATHPELAAKPSDNTLVLAARHAKHQLGGKRPWLPLK